METLEPKMTKDSKMNSSVINSSSGPSKDTLSTIPRAVVSADAVEKQVFATGLCKPVSDLSPGDNTKNQLKFPWRNIENG